MTICRGCNVESDGQSNESTGDIVCPSCGVVWEENTIVNAVEFSETAGGRQYVSATSSKPYGASSGYGQSRDSSEASIETGKREIAKMIARLSISAHLAEPAHRLYVLAVQNKFTHGRRTQHVLAACIYLACRRDNVAVLLIDFADTLQTNVFVLGTTYLKLCSKLNLEVHLQDPTLYIHRYAARLELGDPSATNAVAQTAQRLIARMKRDWIYTGRRPAGICGACLLIAARIHGFRRTRAEVQAIVRVAEGTLKNRLAEFENTPSSLMTPDEFQRLELVDETLPPAYIRGLIDDALTTERAMLEDALAQDTAPLALMDMREKAAAEDGAVAEAAAVANMTGGALTTLEALLRDETDGALVGQSQPLGSTPGWSAAAPSQDAPDKSYVEAAVRRGALRPSAPAVGSTVSSRRHADLLVSEDALARVLAREPALKQYLDMSLLVSARDIGPTLSSLVSQELKEEMHRLSKPADPTTVALTTEDTLAMLQGFTAEEEDGDDQAMEDHAVDGDGTAEGGDTGSVSSGGRKRRARHPPPPDPLDPLDVAEAAAALGRGPLTIDDMRVWKARALLHNNWGRGRGGFDQYRKQYEADIVRTARTLRDARESTAGDAAAPLLEDEAATAPASAAAARTATTTVDVQGGEPATSTDADAGPTLRRSTRTRARSTRLRADDDDETVGGTDAPAPRAAASAAQSRAHEGLPTLSVDPSAQLQSMVKGSAGVEEDANVLAAFAAASDKALRSVGGRKRRRHDSSDDDDAEDAIDDDDDDQDEDDAVRRSRSRRKQRRAARSPSASDSDEHMDEDTAATMQDDVDGDDDGGAPRKRKTKRARKRKAADSGAAAGAPEVITTDIDQAYVDIASQIAGDARKAVTGADTAIVALDNALGLTSPTRLLYDRTRGPSAASVPPSLLVQLPPRVKVPVAVMHAANRNHVMPPTIMEGETTVLPDLSDDEELDDCILDEQDAAERKAVWHELHADYLTAKRKREAEAEKKRAGGGSSSEKKPSAGRMQHRRSAASGPDGVRSVLAAATSKHSSKLNYSVIEADALFELTDGAPVAAAVMDTSEAPDGRPEKKVKPRKPKKPAVVESVDADEAEPEVTVKPRKKSKATAASAVDAEAVENAAPQAAKPKAAKKAVSSKSTSSVDPPDPKHVAATQKMLAMMRANGSLTASTVGTPASAAAPAAAAPPMKQAPAAQTKVSEVVKAAVTRIVVPKAAARAAPVQEPDGEDDALVHGGAPDNHDDYGGGYVDDEE